MVIVKLILEVKGVLLFGHPKISFISVDGQGEFINADWDIDYVH